jgi:hypothetical protein
MAEQDWQNRTERTAREGCQDRTARTRIAKTGCLDRIVRTRQPEQDYQDSTASTSLLG